MEDVTRKFASVGDKCRAVKHHWTFCEGHHVLGFVLSSRTLLGK